MASDWDLPNLTTDVVPIAIQPPSMQAVSSFVLPKNCVYAINFCSSEGFPSAIDSFIDLLTLIGDLDEATTTDRDGIETRA